MTISNAGPETMPGNIDTPTAYKKARYPETISEEKSEPINGLKQKVQNNRYKVLAGLLQEEKKPLLQPPKILRVLLLPYKGEGEELFMSRYVYVKIENSKWTLTDLMERKSMFAWLLQQAILGPRQYLKQSDLDKMTRRTPFSSFLNYLVYYPDLEVFLNQDGIPGKRQQDFKSFT
ncbi:TraV family lipoprotein [Desulforhopalus sp. IMCC35007]|uniref:TraV family lipoprotein n=1 Tax=Desulforhopalus sp. IMCC35007 TaxID=2569543 RepID=UPI0010AE33A4|nr:TraV family lipoprotein [Desulforhopalus sp. IMCC35007]TKB11313.1 hypothetical protein FCL48_04710 [Desulforhopalus sp. IMCC35007]